MAVLATNPFFKRKYDDAFMLKPNQGGHNASWRNAKTQKSFGTEWIKIDPTKTLPPQPKQVEFQLESSRPLKFNNMTRFFIDVSFEKKDPPVTPATTSDWTPMVADDANHVILAPNWFEKMLSGFDLYLGNNRITPHDEHPLVSFELNSLLYYFMSPHVKKILFPQTYHPCSHHKTAFADKKWGDVAIHLFKEGGVSFFYVPLHVFPFCQTPNFIADGPQQDLPLNHIGKMYFRINFKDNYSSFIFKKKVSTSQTEYRVIFNDFYLLAEEDRLSPVSNRIPRNVIEFKGITRDSRLESIKNGETFYRTRFLKNPFPEQVLIFALSKDVIGGTQKFESQDLTKPFILQHNLKEVVLRFDGQDFSSKEPNFSGLSDVSSGLKYMENVLRDGICGMMPNIDLVSFKDAIEEYRSSPYPHVLINYTIDGTRDRIQPLLSDGTALKNDAPIDILLKFHDGGASNNATYVIYLIYTDYSMMYDFKTNKFTNYYKTTTLV